MSRFNRRDFFTLSLLGGIALKTPLKAFGKSKVSEKEILHPYHSSTGNFSHSELVHLTTKFGSPLYVYDWDKIKEKFNRFSRAFKNNYSNVKVHYAYKANTNLNITSLLKSLGAGAECISIGEMKIALKSKTKPEDIIFTSSSKSREELEFALSKNILINVDSLSGLDNLIRLVDEKKKNCRVCLRVNPDVEAKTHKHIATGKKFTKFGMIISNGDIYKAAKKVINHKFLKLEGIHSHIGSQILSLEPFEKNVSILSEVGNQIKKKFEYEIEFINLGGGLGIPYKDGEKELAPELMASVVCSKVKTAFQNFKNKPAIWLEPGRYFVADAGILLSRVNSVKKTQFQNFINVNTGFNHLARPIMYEAYHRVRILGRNTKPKKFKVAGNICETGDILTQIRLLPEPRVGDIIAILDAGAYGFSMASEYNSFFLPAEIARKGKEYFTIRKREDFDDLLRNQKRIRALT